MADNQSVQPCFAIAIAMKPIIGGREAEERINSHSPLSDIVMGKGKLTD